jgi:hypothetical protein
MVGEDDLSVASYATPSSASTAGAGSPSLKRKKKFRKAPQAPRRFRSPYILFSISKMQEYKKSMAKHGVQVTSFSSRIAQDWKKLPDHEREKWEEAALQDKLRYNAEKELYTGPWQVPTGRSRKVRPLDCLVVSSWTTVRLTIVDRSLFLLFIIESRCTQTACFCVLVLQSNDEDAAEAGKS